MDTIHPPTISSHSTPVTRHSSPERASLRPFSTQLAAYTRYALMILDLRSRARFLHDVAMVEEDQTEHSADAADATDGSGGWGGGDPQLPRAGGVVQAPRAALPAAQASWSQVALWKLVVGVVALSVVPQSWEDLQIVSIMHPSA